MLKVKTLNSVKSYKPEPENTADILKTKRAVEKIINEIKEKKDRALFPYIKKYDKWNINKNNVLIKTKSREAKKLIKTVDESIKKTLNAAYENILNFNLKTKEKTYLNVEEDKITGLLSRPFNTIGIYIPGGNFSLVSTVLMLGIPAKIAGTKRIILTTKADKKGEISPEILYACELVGIDEIYKISGPFAIAAMAFGTDTIPKVDKIFGPGNKFVTEAKKQLISEVGIDMLAGPSEVVVIADKTGNPSHIACDLLAQAEHDSDAKVTLISNNTDLIKNINKEIKKKLETLSPANKKIAKNAIENNGRAFRVSTFNNCLELANIIAPEHLSIQTKETKEIEFNLFGHAKLSSNNFKKVLTPILEKLENAGAIFLGHNTSISFGDFVAGPNHTLPTNGSARWASALSINDFLKRSNVYYYTKDRLEIEASDIEKFATIEKLDAHNLSVSVRKSDPEKE